MAPPEQHRPPRRPLAACLLALALALVAASPAAAHSFPYVPTQLLTPTACFNDSACRGRDVAYVFAQTEDHVQLLAFNLSVDLSPSTRPQTVTAELPFLNHAGPTTAFGAVRTGNGTIMVHAGACDGDAADVWSFDPGNRGAGWIKRPMTKAKSTPGSEPPQSPFFLGGTLAFSSRLAPSMDQPTIYTYGGMCASPQAEPNNWQSAANYSKTMTSLAPDSQQPDAGYALGVASVAGPRAPFAGFTLTQLPPSMTNISGSLTQQASFVFLGGHTQNAYINMSTAAVWSLPEESWSYVNIQPPAPAPGRELAIRQVPSDVDSRSGHTTVLSEDGKSMAVLGGWVGDVSTAAEPQLAVLEMNQTYSSWRWTVPAQQPDGTGIYGHGAAMLPGNVMMVYGGWETRPPSSKAKRQDAAASPRFFNLTSMAWVSSYRNPRADSLAHEAPDAAGSAPTARRLGLGIGLGLGVAVVLGFVVLLCMWRRRQRRQKAVRDAAIRAMAEDATHFLHDGGDMAERDDYFSWGRRDWRASGPDPHQQHSGQSALAYESLRGDGQGPHPAPAVITRKPVPRGQRAGYVPAESRFSAFVSPPGVIHPILEDDEEESSLHHYHHEDPHHLPSQHQQRPANEPLASPASDILSDPFVTPTATAPPIIFPPSLMSPAAGRAGSPEEAPRHDPDVQDWVSDVDANDGLLARYGGHHRQGRISPTRRNSNRSVGVWDDESRTGSNLSESNRSVAADSIRRTMSGRRSAAAAGFLATPALFAGGGGNSTDQRKPGSSSSSSYNTARSGFGALQAEAPSLLLGNGAGGRTTPSSPTGYDDDEPGSPSKSKPPPSPRRGWLGSLRRVFSTSSSSSPASTRAAGLVHDDEPSPRRPSFERTGSDYESRLVGLSGELLRRKQGRQDWEAQGGGSGAAAQQHQPENDWDIERAAEQRLVQVMFTVPRERLRVVNADDAADGQQQQTDEGGSVPGSALQQHQPQVAELVDPDPSSQESGSSLDPSPDQPRGRDQRRHEDVDVEPLLLPPPSHHHRRHRSHQTDEPRLSHSTDGSVRPLSGSVYTAEAVTLARPRTRVLQMVDSIESLSRGSSPVRGGGDEEQQEP
ncbi:galactose oxidase [Hirsutella rhossiliensis]|uniref:Galactose oxidase n=1 Tax=Hirsutella rhossiliensis TaxID=111463 RepID=A0A9P8SGZ2_9HYPO|nr:galactose oxidase [Hirsutella rhossiliensis]KAH0960995.1 galactose oxidase [Hirsutella rhossiliensis]